MPEPVKDKLSDEQVANIIASINSLQWSGVTEELAYKLATDLQAARQRLADELKPLKCLLAVMNRDGGHHQDKVGVKQAAEDARQEWHAMQDVLDGLRSELEAARRKRKQSSEIIAKLVAKAVEARTERDTLKAELEAARREIHHRKQAMTLVKAASDECIDGLKADLDTLKAECERLKSELVSTFCVEARERLDRAEKMRAGLRELQADCGCTMRADTHAICRLCNQISSLLGEGERKDGGPLIAATRGSGLALRRSK